jgi:lycopene beta-cyclase
VSAVDGWQYLLVLGSCVLVTLPLEFIGGARVYRRPRALLATLAPVVAAFGGWDLIAVHRGDWWFSARYTLGPRLAGLPVEEWLFFLVVPVCALLTYEVLGRGAHGPRFRSGRRAGR